MMRNFVLTISIFSFLMLSISSMAHLDGATGDNATQIETIDMSDLALLETVSDCHSSGSCHVNSHILSTYLNDNNVLKSSLKRNFGKRNSLLHQRQYPPFQPPIT